MSWGNIHVLAEKARHHGRVARVLCCCKGRLSIQASSMHYCHPQADDAGWYSHFEVYVSDLMPVDPEVLARFIRQCEDAGGRWSEDDRIVPYAPAEAVDDLVTALGGPHPKIHPEYF